MNVFSAAELYPWSYVKWNTVVYFATMKKWRKVHMGCLWDCNEFSARIALSVLLTAQKQVPVSVSSSPPSCWQLASLRFLFPPANINVLVTYSQKPLQAQQRQPVPWSMSMWLPPTDWTRHRGMSRDLILRPGLESELVREDMCTFAYDLHLLYIRLHKLCCLLKHHSHYILRLPQSLMSI